MGVRRGQGEGSIFQRADGTWVAQLDLGYVAGKRKRPIRRARTKKEALAKLEQLKRERDAGAVSETATVEQWLTYWLDRVVAQQLKAGDLKPATATRYRQDVNNWLLPHLGKVRLDRLAPRHIRTLHEAMRDAGRSEATIRNAHAALRRALVIAQADGKIARLPFGAVAAPTPKRTFEVLTVEQAGRVIETAAAAGPRTLARIHVAILAGLRQGEALALRWDDITDTHIRVRSSIARVDGKLVHQRPKTASGVRDVPLAPALAQSLAVWRGASGGQGYVFHGYRGPGYVEGQARDHRAWKAVLAAAGVPAVPLHGARGTCATILQQHGIPPRVVADYLGQSQVRVTLDHYSHSDDAQRTHAAGTIGAAVAALPIGPA